MKLEDLMMNHEGEELQLVIESKATGERLEYRHSGYHCRRDKAPGCLIIGEGSGFANPCTLRTKDLSVRRMDRILNFMWDIDAEYERERYGILIGNLLYL